MYKKPQRHTEILKEQILPKQQELGFGRIQRIKALPKKGVAQGNREVRQQIDSLTTSSDAHAWIRITVLGGKVGLQKFAWLPEGLSFDSLGYWRQQNVSP